jgi:hypothetical protein
MLIVAGNNAGRQYSGSSRASMMKLHHSLINEMANLGKPPK